MANISKQAIEKLKEMGYAAWFSDDMLRETPIEKATRMGLVNTIEFETFNFKLPISKEVTFEWIADRMAKKSAYVSFVNDFKKLLPTDYRNRISVRATTYGIGVDNFYNLDRDLVISVVSSILDKLGIIYKNEYSDARWVYRFVISKSESNIKAIQSCK